MISKAPVKLEDSVLQKIIQRAKQELEQMIDLNPQIMLLVSRDGAVMRVNKSLMELLQLEDYREVIGRNMKDIFPCDDATFFDRLLNDKTNFETLDTIINCGNDRALLIRFTAMASNAKAEVFVVIMQDVSVERENSIRLEKKLKREAVRQLAGALMHSVNQPLTVITIKAQLMHLALQKGDVQPQELNESLQEIVNHTMHISEILRSVERPDDFVTQEYLDGVEIFDIGESKSKDPLSDAVSIGPLEAVIEAFDTHDPTLSGHSRRTGRCAAILAKHMGLSDIDVAIVHRCGIVHDIGKIGIPDAILNKAESLTEEETAHVRKHSEIGCHILLRLPFAAQEADTAYAHHEKFNGKGYPRGLAGTDIPLFARIVAVADVYDALRFIRVYQESRSIEETVREIAAGSGTHFDPAVVEAFKQCHAEFET